MSKTKRILAFALAAVLAVVVLSGCKSIAQKVFGSSNEVQEDDLSLIHIFGNRFGFFLFGGPART